MKKSILFGALAMFAIGALSIQDANAQNAEVKSKKAETTVVKSEKQPTASTVAQEPVKQKKDDCCADKKACAEKKKADNCCEGKKVAADQKKADCCADKKACADKKKADCCESKKVAADGKKADCKKECKHGDKKCDAAKKETATDK
jgi:hypothetical protein